MPPSSAPSHSILIVEDNPGDIGLLRAAFQKIDPTIELVFAGDGIEALALLRRDHRPDLVLLDLNLPRMDGRELLALIKKDPLLRPIPVLVLTSSAAESDVRNVYDLQANGYLVKPDEYSGYLELARQTRQYWFSTIRLPTHSH
ncbi:MAG: response regulator [Planctomycetaceae bacterium]|nr:response regulator [Planctomycetaceae bacterium]